MQANTDDVRIAQSQPLITPAILAEELPLSAGVAAHIQQSRQTIENILSGEDARVPAIVGPCSVPGAAPGYGQSITDACLSLQGTLPLLEQLVGVIRQR